MNNDYNGAKLSMAIGFLIASLVVLLVAFVVVGLKALGAM